MIETPTETIAEIESTSDLPARDLRIEEVVAQLQTSVEAIKNYLDQLNTSGVLEPAIATSLEAINANISELSEKIGAVDVSNPIGEQLAGIGTTLSAQSTTNADFESRISALEGA